MTTQTRIGAALISFALLSLSGSVFAQAPAPRPARAPDEHGRVAVGLNVGLGFRTQAAYDLFAEDDLAPRVGISLGYDVMRIERISLAVEGGFDSESSSARFAANGQAELLTRTYYAAAIGRYALAPWLEPHVRLELGTTLARAKITGDGTRTLRGSDTSFTSALGAGLTFRTRPGAMGGSRRAFRPGFAFRVEGGYLLGTAVDFRVRPSLADEEIPVAPVDLGRLRLGAPYVRFSALFTF